MVGKAWTLFSFFSSFLLSLYVYIFFFYIISGEFLASRRRHKEAAVLYEKSAELRPNDYELSVAAATAMRQAGRYQDAEKWYRKAVAIKPTVKKNTKSLFIFN